MIPNISEYQEKTAKGLISIQKIDLENYAIGTKRFDPTDGSELPMEVVGVTMSEVDEQIKEYQAKIAELESFKKDLIATK